MDARWWNRRLEQGRDQGWANEHCPCRWAGCAVGSLSRRCGKKKRQRLQQTQQHLGEVDMRSFPVLLAYHPRLMRKGTRFECALACWRGIYDVHNRASCDTQMRRIGKAHCQPDSEQGAAPHRVPKQRLILSHLPQGIMPQYALSPHAVPLQRNRDGLFTLAGLAVVLRPEHKSSR